MQRRGGDAHLSPERFQDDQRRSPSRVGITITGPVSVVTAMNGSGGHIWLAEALEQAPGGTRVDFEAATGKYLGVS